MGGGKGRQVATLGPYLVEVYTPVLDVDQALTVGVVPGAVAPATLYLANHCVLTQVLEQRQSVEIANIIKGTVCEFLTR